MNALSQTLTLKDERVLGYAESGDLKGSALFIFHGLNSSRLEVNIAHEAMLRAGIRCIGIDRPGMGLSTFKKDRTVLCFTEDVEALADHLALDKFYVMAVSAGTPYALACTYKIPHRVIACGIISGVAPVFIFGVNEMAKKSRTFILLAQRSPWLIKYLFWFLHGRISQNTVKENAFLEGIMFALDDVDKDLIKVSSAKRVLLETFREGYRQGSKGVAYDGILAFGKPWGFELKEIDFTPIYLWHGEKDKGIPSSMAKSMAQSLVESRLKTYSKEGHLSIVFNQLDEILDDFLQRKA